MFKIDIKRISLFTGPNFELSSLGLGLSTVGALLLSSWLYSWLQKDSQAELVQAYHSANVLCALFEKEPSLAQGNCDKAFNHQLNGTYSDEEKRRFYNTQPYGEEQLYVLFKAAGIVDPNEISVPSDINDFARFPAAAYLAHVIQNNQQLQQFDPSISTANMIIQLAGAMGNKNVMNKGARENLFYQFYLATALANVQISKVEKEEKMETTYGYLAELIYLLNNQDKGQGGTKATLDEATFTVGKSTFSYAGNYWDTLPLKGLVMSNPMPPSDADVLSQLLIGKKVIKDRSEGWGANEGVMLSQLSTIENNVTEEQKYQVFDGSQKLLLYLISQLHSHQQVSNAREYAVKVRGYEQAGMFFLAVLILNIIILRFIRRLCENHQLKKLFKINNDAFAQTKNNGDASKNYQQFISAELSKFSVNWKGTFVVGNDSAIERIKAVVEGKLNNPGTNSDIEHLRAAVSLKDEKLYGSRWIIRWAAMTLPALGFIGTVRGILTSLTGADAIVWATTQAERADAISQLAGELGLAFATTFIALLAGILVSFFNEQQTKSESSFIQELESWAVSALDIHLYELYGKKHYG